MTDHIHGNENKIFHMYENNASAGDIQQSIVGELAPVEVIEITHIKSEESEQSGPTQKNPKRLASLLIWNLLYIGFGIMTSKLILSFIKR